MGWFLIVVGTVAATVAATALAKPLPTLYLTTRERAFYLLELSLISFGFGASMLSDFHYNGVIEGLGLSLGFVSASTMILAGIGLIRPIPSFHLSTRLRSYCLLLLSLFAFGVSSAMLNIGEKSLTSSMGFPLFLVGSATSYLAIFALVKPLSSFHLPTRKRAFILLLMSLSLQGIGDSLESQSYSHETHKDIGILLIVLSIVVAIIGFIGLIRPLPSLHLHTRLRAFYLLLMSFIGYGLGASMQKTSTDSIQDIETILVDPSTNPPIFDRNLENESEEIVKHFVLREIVMKWHANRDRHDGTDVFNFLDLEHSTIRTSGLVHEEINIRVGDGSEMKNYVFFHDGGGEIDLLDGVWKWTGANRGVYAQIDNWGGVESIDSHDYLTIECKGIEPVPYNVNVDFFGIELQNCTAIESN